MRKFRTKVPVKKTRRLYESGLSLLKIAARLGLKQNTVWYAMKRAYPDMNFRVAHRHPEIYQLEKGPEMPMTNDLGGLQWVRKAGTIDELMMKAFDDAMNAEKPDVTLNIETHLFNVLLYSDTCEYHLDIGKHVWLNKGRWSRLIKEYVDRDHLGRFIAQCREIMTGKARAGATASMFFRDPDRFAKKHRWGGCLMSATFRGDNNKAGRATLTFYSRTTYMGYMALLDAAIAHVMAKEITRGIERYKDQRESAISFRWSIASMQIHHFKSLPYIYSRPELMNKLELLAANPEKVDRNQLTGAWYHVAKWYLKVLQKWEQAGEKCKGKRGRCAAMLAAEKYGPFKRIQRRWLEHKGHSHRNLPPSVPIKSLSLEKAYDRKEGEKAAAAKANRVSRMARKLGEVE